MRSIKVVAAIALLVPSIAAAQQKPVLEIGTYAGVSFERMDYGSGNETLTSFEVPQLGIYTAFFPGNRVFIQPELSFVSQSVGGVSARQLGLMVSPAWAFSGVMRNSFYAAPTAGLTWANYSGDIGDDDSQTDYAAGALAGYRVRIRDSLAFRVEAGYLRHFPEVGDDTDLFYFRVGIGGVLNSGAPRTASR